MSNLTTVSASLASQSDDSDDVSVSDCSVVDCDDGGSVRSFGSCDSLDSFGSCDSVDSFGSCDSFESAEGDLALLQHDLHGDSTSEASESVNGPWSQRILALKNSLVSTHWIPGFDDQLSELQSGLLDYPATERAFACLEPELQPGLFSEAAAEWGAKHKGENVSVIICQCPQRDCHFHVPGRLPDHQIDGGVE